MGAALAVSFLAITAIGVPIAAALGIASVFVLFMIDPHLMMLLPQRMFTGLDLFALIAIPFFILAGELMGSSGIMSRILAFSQATAGHIRGSVAQVTILVSILFGWINGSGVAGTSAVGTMLIPEMTKQYKSRPYAAAVTACASTVGPIIPPSVPMIIYALVAENVSVAGMFAAGVIPGLMMGVGMMVVTYFIARRRGYPADHTKRTFAEMVGILRRFMVGLFLPVILVGGIVFGIFTPVEAGAVAVLYAVLVGFLITRVLTFSALFTALVNTAIISSVVFLVMGIANLTSWIVTTEQVPAQVAAAVTAITENPLVFLLLVNIILLVVGCFFDAVAAMVMFVPILVPIANTYGIDPLQFGMIFVVNLTIGLVTPPVGMCLFIASGIADTRLVSVFREAIPYVMVLLLVLLIVTYVPQAYLWLPHMMGY